MTAQQGHLYQFDQAKVMAMKSGGVLVPVRQLVDDGWGLGPVEHVQADRLQPLPMRYFHGQTPK